MSRSPLDRDLLGSSYILQFMPSQLNAAGRALKGLLMLNWLLAAAAAVVVGAQCPAGTNPSFRLERNELDQFGEPFERTAAITLVDVNGDGALDLLAANGRHWPQVSKVYINHNGRFLESHTFDDGEAATAYKIVAGDFRRRGIIDAVIVRDGLPSTLELNDGKGHFTASRQIGPPVGARSAAVGDLSHRGGLDLVVSTRELGHSYVAYTTSHGPFSKIVEFPREDQNTVGVVLGDLDGDGWLDAVFAERGPHGVLVAWNDHGTLKPPEPIGISLGDARNLTLADVRHTGRLDIILARTSDTLIVVNNDGDRHFTAGEQLGPKDGVPYSAVAAADLEGDGHMSIVAARDGGSNLIFVQRQGCWLTVPIGNAAVHSYDVAVGKLDEGIGIVFANSDSYGEIYHVRPLGERRGDMSAQKQH